MFHKKKKIFLLIQLFNISVASFMIKYPFRKQIALFRKTQEDTNSNRAVSYGFGKRGKIHKKTRSKGIENPRDAEKQRGINLFLINVNNLLTYLHLRYMVLLIVY